MVLCKIFKKRRAKMKHQAFALCMASVFALSLLSGCQAEDVGYTLPVETPAPAGEAADARPAATPQPAQTAEPTPEPDLNKTYTLEELKQNSSLRTLLQQYGTVGVDESSDGNPQWEITKVHSQFRLDENGYLQINYLVGDDPLSTPSTFFAVQDAPGYAYEVSFDRSNGESYLTFCDLSSFDTWLDQPWYGADPVFEIPADPVITDTHAENGQIVVTVAYVAQDGTPGDNAWTYYVDPATDLVLRLETVTDGSLGGEILETRHSTTSLTLSPEFEDWSSTVQSVTNAAGGLQVTFRISTTAMNKIEERQMVLTPETYLRTSPGTSTLGFMSEDPLGDETGLRNHPTVNGQVIGVFGGP